MDSHCILNSVAIPSALPTFQGVSACSYYFHCNIYKLPRLNCPPHNPSSRHWAPRSPENHASATYPPQHHQSDTCSMRSTDALITHQNGCGKCTFPAPNQEQERLGFDMGLTVSYAHSTLLKLRGLRNNSLNCHRKNQDQQTAPESLGDQLRLIK